MRLCIHRMVPYLPYGGFPHSDIDGSSLICSYPSLFAAYRVLRRQSVPWHPPCALIRLIFSPPAYWLTGDSRSRSLNVVVRCRVPRSSAPRFSFLAKFSAYCFPVQFSRCVEVSHSVPPGRSLRPDSAHDPSKRYRVEELHFVRFHCRSFPGCLSPIRFRSVDRFPSDSSSSVSQSPSPSAPRPRVRKASSAPLLSLERR